MCPENLAAGADGIITNLLNFELCACRDRYFIQIDSGIWLRADDPTGRPIPQFGISGRIFAVADRARIARVVHLPPELAAAGGAGVFELPVNIIRRNTIRLICRIGSRIQAKMEMRAFSNSDTSEPSQQPRPKQKHAASNASYFHPLLRFVLIWSSHALYGAPPPCISINRIIIT